MRILVISDSHRDEFSIKMAIRKHPDADIVVYLGDGEDDFNACKSLIKTPKVYVVRGNNDFYSSLPLSQIIEANGVKIYLTHGHNEMVKYGTEMLYEKAEQNNCQLVLYGHIHVQRYEYKDGIHTYCPGAVKYGEYGVVDITDNGIMCINMKCR